MKNVVVYLFDVVTEQDLISGKRYKKIEKRTKVIADLQNTGAQTFWQAQQARVNIEATIEMLARSYKNQKYVKVNRQVFTIYNTAKSGVGAFIKLNLVANNDSEIKELVADGL